MFNFISTLTVQMKKIITLIFCSPFLTKTYSQITKGNWLVGGSGNYTVYKVLDEKNLYMQLSPNVGYFFSDKIVAGIKVSYTSNKTGGSTFSGRKTGIYFGPFARYYFLNYQERFNILIEGAYQYGFEKAKGYSGTANKYSLNTFSFAAGPVIYFNTSVGLEFLFGYTQSKYTNEGFHRSQFQISIGLQFHLEKE